MRENCADSGEIIVKIARPIHESDALGRASGLLGRHIHARHRPVARDFRRIESRECCEFLPSDMTRQGKLWSDYGNRSVQKVHG
jgi:hypothetical protein